MDNTPDHKSRGHAEFSPSSLKYVAGCAGYEGRSGTNAAAEKGTRIHEALEVRDPSALHDESEVLIYDMIVADEKAFNESFFGNTPYEELNEIQVQVDLQGTETWGTCDRFLVAGDKAVMADYKTGISKIDSPKDNWQAKAYTLGAFQQFPQVNEIDFVFYIPARAEVLHDKFTRADVPLLTKELSEVIQRGEMVRPKWKGGVPDHDELTPTVNCRFCKHEDHCPALGGLALEVASKVAGEPLPNKEDFDSDDPEILEKLWGVAKVVSNWATRIKAKAVEQAKEGKEFPTLKLKNMGATKKCTDNVSMLEIAETYGVTAEELLSVSSLPIKKITDLVAKKSDKGNKKENADNFLADLEEADIIKTSETRFTLS